MGKPERGRLISADVGSLGDTGNAFLSPTRVVAVNPVSRHQHFLQNLGPARIAPDAVPSAAAPRYSPLH